MKKNRIIALLILCVICLGACLCSCTESTDTEDTKAPTANTSDDKTKDTVAGDTQQDDGLKTYKIKVVDENGTPMAGVVAQICKDACIPAVTDENGYATFKVAEDDYKASMTALPTGYEYKDGVSEYHFEDGQYELTITLVAISG